MAKLLPFEKDDAMHSKNNIDHLFINTQIDHPKNASPSKDEKDNKQENVKHHQSDSPLQDSDSDDDFLNHNCNDNYDHDYDDDDALYMSSNAPNDHVPQSPTKISSHQPNYGMKRDFEGRPRAAVARPRYVYPHHPPNAVARPRYVYPHHPPNYHRIYNRPPPMYVKRTRPPLPYPFSIYEQQKPMVGNDLHHIFSDENVRACSIM